MCILEEHLLKVRDDPVAGKLQSPRHHLVNYAFFNSFSGFSFVEEIIFVQRLKERDVP
jgi:hypothetical protein